MKIILEDLNGIKVIQPDIFSDDRGYFFESYSGKKFETIGLVSDFVQDNISQSVYGTVRGLHYQTGEFAQGKLCQVLLGRVIDVAVDVRFGSPTYGKHISVELSDDNHKQIWIPPGFAHGFSVISDIAVFHYKCTQYYNKASEKCIIYNDSDLSINWQVEIPLVSEKDTAGYLFKNIDKDFIYNNCQ